MNRRMIFLHEVASVQIVHNFPTIIDRIVLFTVKIVGEIVVIQRRPMGSRQPRPSTFNLDR